MEQGLNQLDGVRATVNFAVERARVEHEPTVSASDLIRAVESAGYQASVRSDPVPRPAEDRLLPRLVGPAALAVPVVAFSTVAAWQWLVFALTMPIVAWGGQLARMAKLVTDAQHGKASIQRLADRVAAVFVPAVLVMAAATMACSSLLVVANSLRLERFRD